MAAVAAARRETRKSATAEQPGLFSATQLPAGGRAPLPVLGQRGDTAFYELAGSRIATPGTGMMQGCLTVNPYVGCEMSCSYW